MWLMDSLDESWAAWGLGSELAESPPPRVRYVDRNANNIGVAARVAGPGRCSCGRGQAQLP